MLLSPINYLLPRNSTITDWVNRISCAWYGIYGPAGIPEEAKKILGTAIGRHKNSKPKIDETGNLCEYSLLGIQEVVEENYKQVYGMQSIRLT